MDAQAVIEVALDERQDVLDRLRRLVRICLDLEAALHRLEHDDRTGARRTARRRAAGLVAGAGALLDPVRRLRRRLPEPTRLPDAPVTATAAHDPSAPTTIAMTRFIRILIVQFLTISSDGAIPAARMHGTADVLSPRHQIEIDDRPPPRGDRSVKRLFGLLGLRGAHPAQAIRDAMDVDVHADVAAALEPEDQHEVRGLATDARQRHQLLHRRRHTAIEVGDEHLAARFHVPRLVAIEANRIDQPLDLGDREPGHRSRRASPLEQARRRGVRGRVLRARGQKRRDQYLEWILCLGLRDLLDRRQLHAGDLTRPLSA